MVDERTIPRFWWLRRLTVFVVGVFALMIAAQVLVTFHFDRQADAAEAMWRALPVRMPEDPDGSPADLNDPRNPAFHMDRAGALLPPYSQTFNDWEVESRTWPPMTAHDIAVLRPTTRAMEPAFFAIIEARRVREAGGDYQWALGPLSIDLLLWNLAYFRDLSQHLSWALRLAHRDGDLVAMVNRAHDLREMSLATRSYADVLVSVMAAVRNDTLTADALRESAGHVPPNRTHEEDAALWRESREPVLALGRMLADSAYFEELRSTAYDAEWIFAVEVRDTTSDYVTPRNVLTAPTLDRSAILLSEWAASVRNAAIAGGPFPIVKAKVDLLPKVVATTSLAGLAAAGEAEAYALDAERSLEVLYAGRVSMQSAAVALALRVYEADHDALPVSLEALVPDYLPEAPIDPFDADERPLRLIERDGLMFINSVGPNGIDDGGDPRNGSGNLREWTDAADLVLPLCWDGNGDPLERLAATFE